MRKNNMNRWKKITALLLSAAMTIPMAPGAVYAAEDPNSAAVIEEAVMPEEQVGSVETDTSASPGESGEVTPSAQHEHQWDYSSISSGNVSSTISCSETTCTSGNVTLTLISGNELNAPYVQVSGNELPHENEWRIKYTIRYVADGVETDAPPEAPGSYKVRAYFGDGTEHYLETDYVVGPKHEHHWDYSSISSGDVSGIISCSGNQDLPCPMSESVNLTLISGKDENGNNKVSLLANGEEVKHGDAWEIQYEIRYSREDSSEIWTESNLPEAPGAYKVRAFFDGREDLYLQAEGEYVVEHEHDWSYEKISGNTAKITCSGNGGCEDSAEGIEFTLNVVKESEYVEAGRERVNLSANVLSANGQKDPIGLDKLTGLGISWNKVYCKNADGALWEQEEPQGAGTYRVKVVFADGVTLEETFKIGPAEQVSGQVVMNSYTYGDSKKAQIPTINGASGIQERTYWYYKENEESKPHKKLDVKKFNAKSLNAGTYYIEATFTRVNDENYTYRTDAIPFTVNKATHDKKITVTMKNFDLEGKWPTPGLQSNKKKYDPKKLDRDSKITYYYSNNIKMKGKKVWKKNCRLARKKNGAIYYMQAVISSKAENYEQYETKPQKFIVYAYHDWKGISKKDNLPKKELAEKEQTKIVKCSHCGKKQTVRLPKKTISVTMGKSANLVSKGTSCTFTTKVKEKYFRLQRGRIITKADPKYYGKMKTSIPVAVTVCGKTYTMNVKLKIPKPNVTIEQEKKNTNGTAWHKFIFTYNIPGASGIEVTMDRATSDVRRDLERYVCDPKSSPDSYLGLKDTFLQGLNNKVTFRITAYYGNNRSETLTRTETVK